MTVPTHCVAHQHRRVAPRVKLTVVASTILISAGEASGDLYAAGLVRSLQARRSDLEFFGCAGPKMRAAGVEPIVDSARLAVVGLVEVLRHIPGIYGEYRKLLRAVAARRPSLAILTDSPDFNLRLARQLKRMRIPVVYLVAPQVWAWRKRRLPMMRRTIARLLCIFPFEKAFFEGHGIPTTYIGHPLTRLIRPSAAPAQLRPRFLNEPNRFLVALLPGSRKGEALRHMDPLIDAAERISKALPVHFILALPEGFSSRADLSNFQERFSRASIQVIEGETWDVLASADLALAASGTVTMEACILETPMITFYRVNPWSAIIGRMLVKVPFFSMVNLIAERRLVVELIQEDFTGQRLAAEALKLLKDDGARSTMRADLGRLAETLAGSEDPMEVAASEVERFLIKEMAHVS